MKRFLKGIIFIFTALILLVSLFPLVLSSKAGKEFILTQINKRIPGEIQIEKLHLSWFGKQTAQGLELFDPNGEKVLDVQSLSTDEHLLLFLYGIPRNAEIKRLNVTIQQGDDQKTNLQKSLNFELPKIPVDQTLTLTDVDATLSKNQIKISGFTKRGSASGAFTVVLTGDQEKDKWVIDLKEFPVEIFDGLYSIQQKKTTQLLSSILGGKVNVKLLKEGMGDELSFRVNISSPTTTAEVELKGSDPLVIHLNADLIWQKEPIKVLVDATLKQPIEKSSLESFNIDDFVISSEATMENGAKMTLDAKGKFHETLQQSQIAVVVDGHQVPSHLAEPIVEGENIASLFGKLLDFKASLDLDRLQGPIAAKISGDLGELSLNGEAKGTKLLLKEPFVVNTKNAQALKTLFVQQFPVLHELVDSKGIFQLTVSPEQFYLPLFFNVKNLQIGNAKLQIAELVFKNSGDLKKLLKILRPAKSATITLKTTPLYFSMKDGVIKIERTDMLVHDRYPIAAWGHVDLIKDHMDMRVGITGYALEEAFGLKVDRLTMLQIPVYGRLSSPVVDQRKLTAKIAGLMTNNSKVLSSFAKISLNDDDSDVPPPTTNPLPWNAMLLSQKEEKGHKKTAKKPKDPLDEIQEEASKFLKKIWK